MTADQHVDGGEATVWGWVDCPHGCNVSAPAWDERGRWQHMDAAHRDTYSAAVEGGYDLRWPKHGARSGS